VARGQAARRHRRARDGGESRSAPRSATSFQVRLHRGRRRPLPRRQARLGDSRQVLRQLPVRQTGDPQLQAPQRYSDVPTRHTRARSRGNCSPDGPQREPEPAERRARRERRAWGQPRLRPSDAGLRIGRSRGAHGSTSGGRRRSAASSASDTSPSRSSTRGTTAATCRRTARSRSSTRG
jgi:hypothetical protein